MARASESCVGNRQTRRLSLLQSCRACPALVRALPELGPSSTAFGQAYRAVSRSCQAIDQRLHRHCPRDLGWALRVRLYLFTASQTISHSAAIAKNHDDPNTERPLPQPVVIT